MLAIAGAGFVAVLTARSVGYQNYSLFYEQFARIEIPSLVLVGLFSVLILLSTRRSPPEAEIARSTRFKPWIMVVLAAVVFCVVYGGILLVFHRFLLADDEYSAWFQAQIFASGRAHARVPADWCRWIDPITPSTIAATNCTWRLAFLPLHSLLNAPFIALGLDRLGGPLTAVASLLLVAAICRKAWPAAPQRAYLAALFFAASMQMLFMSMTFFSMPTHLLFSLAWLWLFVDNRRWSLLLLPWVGVLALGVHSPYPHALFATVFVLRYLRSRRFVLFGYVAAVYVAGLIFWYRYMAGLSAVEAPSVRASASATAQIATHAFSVPAAPIRLTWAMHLALIPTWNCLIVGVLVLAAMLRWKRLDTFARDLALSLLFIVFARAFLSQTPQGEGWGYRYVYDALGSLAILAAIGAEDLVLAVGHQRATRLIGVALAAAVFVQLPLRAKNVDTIIGPYRRGYEWMSSLPYPIVVYPAQAVAWGRQLVRNQPSLRNRPIIMNDGDLTKEARRALGADSAGSRGIKLITGRELRGHGFPLSNQVLGSIVIVP